MLIEFDGLFEFDRLEHYFDAWWPGRALDLFGEALTEDTRLRLEDDESGPRGEDWPEWSPAYAATRGPEHKLLFDTGTLSRTLDARRRGDVLDFGSPEDYALVHQYGSRDGRIPARPYVGVSRELRASLDPIFGADFERGWR
jgi:hypothetical protein